MLQENQLFANRYRLVKRLGQGAYSEVWKAEDSKAGNLTVALKVYVPDKGLDEDGAKIFSEEYAIVFNLHHSNLLTPNYFDEENKSPYLVLPFCEKGSATRLIGKADERQVAQFLRDVSSALAYLHESEIVHQDIKPDNVLIDKSGNYLLTDFGISTRIRSTFRRSVGGKSSAGTTAYMGPERFSKTPAPVKASDVWSLGATVYEIMTGDVPFGDMGGGMQRMNAEIPDIPDGYSPELKQLVERCLAPDTWDRPTAAQLRDMSEGYLRTGKWDLSMIDSGAKPDEKPQEPSQDDRPSKRPTQRKVQAEIDNKIVGGNEHGHGSQPGLPEGGASNQTKAEVLSQGETKKMEEVPMKAWENNPNENTPNLGKGDNPSRMRISGVALLLLTVLAIVVAIVLSKMKENDIPQSNVDYSVPVSEQPVDVSPTPNEPSIKQPQVRTETAKKASTNKKTSRNDGAAETKDESINVPTPKVDVESSAGNAADRAASKAEEEATTTVVNTGKKRM